VILVHLKLLLLVEAVGRFLAMVVMVVRVVGHPRRLPSLQDQQHHHHLFKEIRVGQPIPSLHTKQVVGAEQDLLAETHHLQVIVWVVLDGILFYLHPHMELPDHLLQHHNIDTLLVVEVVAGLRLLLLDIQQSLVHLVVLVAEVHLLLVVLELQEPQILVVEVEEDMLPEMVVMAVQVLLLFNIQNKEIKTYGTFCSNWIRK
jgi:hypothetical protein